MRMAFFHKGYEDLGIQALSAYLKARGHAVDLYYDGGVFSSQIGLDNRLLSRLFDIRKEELERRVAERMAAARPDLVGFGGPTASLRWSLDWAAWIKERFGTPIVYGGPHATTAPETLIREPHVDAVVRGEGEEALAEILEAVEGGRFVRTDIANAWFKRDGEIVRNPVRPYIEDLDRLPFFDKDLFNDKVDVFYKQYMTVSGRGCPFRCTYCSQAAYKDLYGKGARHVRRRSPEHVVSELAAAKARRDMRFVSFRDDVFTLDADWLSRFADLYAADVGLPFFCYGHPAAITPPIADALARAGCRQIKIGVQSFDEEVRRSKLQRKYTDERIFEVAGLLKERGIEVLVDHMLLLPGETDAQVAHAVDRYIDLQPDSITNFYLVLLPGTPMVDIAFEEGMIGEADRDAVQRGEAPAEFSRPEGDLRRTNARRLKYQYYMDLVPLVPKELMRFLFRHRLLHLLPYSFTLRQLILALSDVAKRNIRLRYMLWYVLARKSFP